MTDKTHPMYSDHWQILREAEKLCADLDLKCEMVMEKDGSIAVRFRKNIFRPEIKNLLIVNSKDNVKQLEGVFSDEWMISKFGEPINGYSFDKIVVCGYRGDGFAYGADKKVYSDWIGGYLKTKLKKDGKIVFV